MAKKNTNITRVEFEELQNTVATLAQSVNALSVQVASLVSLQAPAQESEAPRKKQSKSNSKAVGKKSTSSKAPKSKSVALDDVTNERYRPEKQDDNFKWASYKKKRTEYCVAVLTGGQTVKCSEVKKLGYTIDTKSKGWIKSQRDYAKHWGEYVKVGDR